MADELISPEPAAPSADELVASPQTSIGWTQPGTGPRDAAGFFDAVYAGLQGSASGLALRGRLPDVTLAEEAPFLHRMGAAIGQLSGDAPASLVGMFAGAAAPVPPPGQLPWAKMALMGAGAFAAPAMVREGLTQYYRTGSVDMGRLALTGAKEATIGALTFAAGGYLSKVMPTPTAFLGKIVRQAGIAGGEVATMVGAKSILDWHLPSAQEFMDNAVLIFGLRAAREVGVPILARVYERTGKSPKEVAIDAANDSKVAQDLLSGKIPDKYVVEAPPTVVEPKPDAPLRPRERVEDEPEYVAQKRDEVRNDFNLRHFDSEEGMHGALSILASEEAARIEIARRGTMTKEQIVAEGNEQAKVVTEWLGQGKKIREVGDAATAAEMIGTAKALSAHFQSVRDAAASLETARRDVDAGKMDDTAFAERLADYAVRENQLKALIADYLGQAAEVGRALGSIRYIKEQVGDVKALLKAINEKHGSVGQLLNRASVVHAARSNREIAGVVKVATKFDKVIEWWKSSILSGPTSHIVNLTSGLVFGAMRIPRTFAAAMVSTAGGQGHVLYRQAAAEAMGMTAGLLEGMRAAGRTLRSHYYDNVLEVSGKAESQKGAIGTSPDSSRTAQLFGKAVRTPFALLSAGDAFVKTINQYATAYSAAAHATKGNLAKVVSPSYYRDFMQKAKVLDAEGRLQPEGELGKLMFEDGIRYTFQAELGPRANRLMAALYDTPAKYVLPFLLPFVRTPVNIFAEAARGLPLLGIVSKRQRDMWEKGGAARDQAIAEHVVGASMALTVVALAESGVLTGNGPADPTARRAWLLTHQPYSVRIGETWYSYGRLEPVATILGVVADLWAMKDYATEGEYELLMNAAGKAFTNQVTNKSFLQTFSTLSDLLNPSEYNGSAVSNIVASTLGGFIPNVLTGTDRVFDEHVREARTLADKIRARIPLVRQGLLPKRDIFGQPIPKDWLMDLVGIRTLPDPNDPVRTEMARLGYAPTPLNAKEADVIPGPFTGKVEFDDEQFDAMRTQAGQTAHQLLSQIVATPGYQAAPDAYKRAIIEQVFSQSRLQARYGAITRDQLNKAIEDVRREIGGE